MDFRLSAEEKAVARNVEEFACNEIAPSVQKRDETGEWDWQLWKQISDLGLAGMPIPEIYGGSGASAVTSLLAYEAFTKGSKDPGLYLSIGAHLFLCSVPIWLHGSESQKLAYLPKLTSGQKIGAFALTEPNAGSDAAGIETTARREGDFYVLKGSKMFITNGPVADVVLVMATMDRSKRAKGLTAFIVEKGMPGFSAGKKIGKMGHRTSPTSELILEDCRVPVQNRIGEEGEGFEVMSSALVWERGVFLAAESLGMMAAMLEDAIAYARQRTQFGKAIAEYQPIRDKLARMKVVYDAARLLSLRAAWMKDAGLDARFEASIAKAFYADELVRFSDEALQVYGGYGYTKEYPIERMYRDARLMPIGGGTSEVQRMVVSSHLIRG